MEPSVAGSRPVSSLNTRFLSLLEHLPMLGGEAMGMVSCISLLSQYILLHLDSNTQNISLGQV